MEYLVIFSCFFFSTDTSLTRGSKRVFDVSKQVVGQAILHGSNVLISTIEGSRTLNNPCVTYFLNILLDTTLGTVRILASCDTSIQIGTFLQVLDSFTD